MNNKNILLLEDDPEMRNWSHSILTDIFPSHKIYCAETIKSCLSLLNNNEFYLTLLDIHLPDGSGLDILSTIKHVNPDIICVISTIFEDKESIFTALQNGANGYIIKDQSREKLKQSLQEITQGKPALSPAVAITMMNFFKNNSPIDDKHNLTRRQIEILTMIAKGMQNKEVARELNLSVYTIMDHIKNLYLKLHVTSRAEAAIKAHKMGLIH